MIEQLQGFPDNVLAFVGHGRITRRDYETVLVPAAEKALAKHEKVRVYYQTAPDFAGYEPGAMWEDFKVGMAHLSRWEKVALVTDVDWMSHAVDFFRFMMPCPVVVYPVSEADKAREWLTGSD